MDCRLTVLMTVYNGMPYLRTAIDSILSQTYRDFRFLIVDDGSTDNSREVVRSYDDGRIDLLCLDRNVAQTAALNIGLRHATTPWIARMDADDYSAPTRLEEEMQALEADPSLSCVGTFVWFFRSEPAVLDGTKEYPVRYEEMKRLLVHGSPMTHASIVVNREAMLEIGAYDERYKISADLDMYDRLLKNHRVANVPRLLYGCRTHPNQETASRLAAEENIDIFRRRLAENGHMREEASITRKCLAGHVVSRVQYLGKERRYREAVKDLLWAFSLSPGLVARWYAGTLAYRLLPRRVREGIKKRLRRN